MSVSVGATVRRTVSSIEDRHAVFYGLRDPVVRRALFVLLIVVAVALFLVLRGGDRPAFTFGPSSRASNLGSFEVIGLASAYGHVSPAVAREAERIAGSNPTLARLLRLGDGQPAVVGPWSVGNNGNGGAVLAYRLRQPIAVDSDLPYVAIPPDAPAHGTCVWPYAPGWAHLRGSGVTRLSALVDVSKGRVVEISTNARRGRVTPVGGKPYPTCNENQTGG